MALRELHNRGPSITIDFADGSGVESGKTMLDYKGVAAGMVESVELKPGLTGVVVGVRLKRSAAQLASEGAQFWIVHPEIGFGGVRGLDTLVSGVHLDVLPGAGRAAKHFIGLDKTPAPDVKDEGRSFILQSDKLGSLTTGAPWCLPGIQGRAGRGEPPQRRLHRGADPDPPGRTLRGPRADQHPVLERREASISR